jgi:hypothetical protein
LEQRVEVDHRTQRLRDGGRGLIGGVDIAVDVARLDPCLVPMQREA